jgi:hypothetical protein
LGSSSLGWRRRRESTSSGPERGRGRLRTTHPNWRRWWLRTPWSDWRRGRLRTTHPNRRRRNGRRPGKPRCPSRDDQSIVPAHQVHRQLGDARNGGLLAVGARHHQHAARRKSSKLPALLGAGLEHGHRGRASDRHQTRELGDLRVGTRHRDEIRSHRLDQYRGRGMSGHLHRDAVFPQRLSQRFRSSTERTDEDHGRRPGVGSSRRRGRRSRTGSQIQLVA